MLLRIILSWLAHFTEYQWEKMYLSWYLWTGVVAQALRDAGPELNLQDLAEVIKKTSFKMTRVGELFLRECSTAECRKRHN